MKWEKKAKKKFTGFSFCMRFAFFSASLVRCFVFTSLQLHSVLVKRCEFMQRFELFIRSIPVGHTLSKWKCETEHYIHLWHFPFSLCPLYPGLSSCKINFSASFYCSSIWVLFNLRLSSSFQTGSAFFPAMPMKITQIQTYISHNRAFKWVNNRKMHTDRCHIFNSPKMRLMCKKINTVKHTFANQ